MKASRNVMRLTSRRVRSRDNGMGRTLKAAMDWEGSMRILLALLVAVTIGCAVAAGVTVSFAPAYADGGGY